MITDKYAVYLPAVQNSFAAGVLRQNINSRPMPSGIELSDLVFWNKQNKLWTHQSILYSIGQHSIGSTVDNAVTHGGKTDFFLLGDSGGYQIGTGAIKGFNELTKDMDANEAVEAWARAYEVKHWIISWLDTHCDYAMTLDMPLWATMPEHIGKPFNKCSASQLTSMTVANLKFIEKHRQGRTKWLNVVQGLNEQSTQDWWNSVKWFECSGYALAGAASWRGGLKQFLTTIMMMHDDNAFVSGHDWIHVLGVSTTKWAIILSAIQQQLRTHVNSRVSISYDSASPFISSGQVELAYLPPRFDNHPNAWSFSSIQAPQAQEYVGSDELLNLPSPLGQILTHGHLNVVTDEWKSRKFDTISNLFLANHNTYVLLKAFEDANKIAFESDREQLPSSWNECLNVIEKLLTSNNWREELENNKAVLNAFAPPP